MIKYAALITLATATSFGAPYTFHYSYGASITVEASSYDTAYKNAAKTCFATLTGGAYPGEEAGLTFIDICANPLRSSK